MISICHNSDCANMGTLRCSGCQTVYYCGVACAKSFWKFHKRVCQLRLENVPLPQRYLIPAVNSFPLQCFHVLDALDRSLRIVPPERDFVDLDKDGKKTEKKEKGLYRKLTAFIEKTDQLCQSERAYELFIGTSQIDAVAGADLYEEQLKKTEFPLAFMIRLAAMGNSLKFCIAMISVFETLATVGNLVIMHGRERMKTFFIAKGHVKNTQPRLLTSVEEKVGTTLNKSQTVEQTNDHYVILAAPDCIFNAEVCPEFYIAEQNDKSSYEFDKNLSEERLAWKKSAFGTEERKKNNVIRAVQAAVQSQKVLELVKQMKDVVVFIAPAATEHDASLNNYRLCKSIPEWFHISEIYGEPQIASMRFSEEFSYNANVLMHRIMSDLLGSTRATEIIDRVSNLVAEKEKKEAEKNKVEQK